MAQGGNGAGEIRRRCVGVQIGPIHHERGRGKRPHGQRVIGTGELDVEEPLVAGNGTGSPARNVIGQAGLVHDLDGKVLQQMGESVSLMHSWKREPASPRHRWSAMAGAR